MPSLVKKSIKRKLRVFSRHPSHDPLRDKIFLPTLTCIRLGSLNEGTLKYDVEINSTNAIKVSSNKLLMKQAFSNNDVKTSLWINTSNKEELLDFLEENDFPLVFKSFFGSRGEGNNIIRTREEMETFLSKHDLKNYVIEKYYPYMREYRLHVTTEGCFYTCRKVLKKETPKENQWFRNDSNSNWVTENNELFQKPTNWKTIESECIKALNAVGLDCGAIDVRVQNEKEGKEPDFVILETNSAPSFGDITLQKYLEIIPKIYKFKKACK